MAAIKMRFFGRLTTTTLLLCALLGTSNQQLSSMLGSYQGNSGVRETLLALNAFCGMLSFGHLFPSVLMTN